MTALRAVNEIPATGGMTNWREDRMSDVYPSLANSKRGGKYHVVFVPKPGRNYPRGGAGAIEY